MLLLTYQASWLALTLIAFALLFGAAGASSAARAMELSGSSLFTLGTTAGAGGAQLALCYLEAAIGLTLLALLIAFIPTLYAAYQRREVSVSRLNVRAGVPATAWGILEIAQSVAAYELLDDLWREWEAWFIEVGETHTTLPMLNFYRTPIPRQTWIGSATAVLDAAALFNSAVDKPASPLAGLCIRSGWLTLRALADYFKVPYPTRPDERHDITISRSEFELVLDHLGAQRGARARRPRRGVAGLRRVEGQLRRDRRGLPREVHVPAHRLAPGGERGADRAVEPPGHAPLVRGRRARLGRERRSAQRAELGAITRRVGDVLGARRPG